MPKSQKFGEWKTVGSLGEGGQGRTFLAYREGQPKEQLVVLKELKNLDRRERFEKEIASLQKLSHPGIVKIIDHRLEGDHPYLILEYCKGRDLGQINVNTISLRDRLTVFHQICSAVAAAHAAHVLHRDLKPKNILFRDNLEAVVADFGLALDLTNLESRLTETGEAVGPRDYIAPELEGGPNNEPNPSSDCYSLGKLLYFLLSGRNLPRERHRDGKYNLLSGNAPPLFHFAYELLDRSICENPANRYKNATEFLVASEGVMERLDKSAHVLDLDLRQQCLYCVEGSYQVRLVDARRGQGMAPEPFNGHEFWGDSQTFQYRPWMILVCDICGNVQMFRFDLGARLIRWKNVPKNEL